MATIFYKGLGELHSSILQALDGAYLLKEEPSSEEDFSSAEVFIIGPEEKNPIASIQKINAVDTHISILILSSPQQVATVRRQIQFAPFVGSNTLVISYTKHFDLATAIRNAAQRTRQRRAFNKIKKVPENVTFIGSVPVKVENLGTFLQQAPIGVFLVDNENRIVAVNEKAKQLFSVEENRNYVLPDLFPGLRIQELNLGSSAGANLPSRVIEINKNFLELHVSQVVNSEGVVLHILMVNDVTEQKRKETELEEREALFRFMAEAMPQKVWTATSKGIVDFFNQHWIHYTGLSLEKLKEGKWIESIHPDDVSHVLAVWQQAVRTGQEFELEERIRDKNGEYRWHLVRGVPRKDSEGKVLVWVGTNTDIHDQKEFAMKLERRVEERTFELEKANNELQQFVYITSHDLQEPVRKIRFFSEMLKDGTPLSDHEAKNKIEKISNTALRMNTLLKDLLNFTQMSRPDQVEDTDLNAIVSQTLIDLELVISDKKATVEVNHLPVIKAVPVQMHQLFYNLINNALKFAKPGIDPVVRIRCTTADRSALEQFPNLHPSRNYHDLVVEDNGIGFEQQYAEQMFRIFHRLHNRNEYSGTGIGLAICKKVVSNHYGVIYAMGEKGKGSTFHILLPAEQ